MLTSDLAQSWRRGGRTGPRLLDVTDANLLQVAGDLIAIVRDHHARTRAEIERAFDLYIGAGTDYRILRGLIKLLTDECEFETNSRLEPAEIRRHLFLAARAAHPVIANVETVAARETQNRSDDKKDGETQADNRVRIIAETAANLICTPAEIEAGLYADLAANQQLAAFDEPSPVALLERYNLAQAQALLYRAVEMRVYVAPQDASEARPIFDAIKSYGLVHTISGDVASGYEVTLTGPVSMFHRAQKYGVQMAVFLPALLLCKGWHAQAEIVVKNRDDAASRASKSVSANLIYELDAAQGEVRSHLLPAPRHGNDLNRRLVENWERHESEWTLDGCSEVIDLGATAFVPDLLARHASGAQIYLETFGFWTPTHLLRRVGEHTRENFSSYLFIASDELRCSRDPLTKSFPNVLISKAAPSLTSVNMKLDELRATLKD